MLNLSKQFKDFSASNNFFQIQKAKIAACGRSLSSHTGNAAMLGKRTSELLTFAHAGAAAAPPPSPLLPGLPSYIIIIIATIILKTIEHT